ncbi:hypothetical protein Hanom_Chr06g00558751 [Helianthus anomalus]
MMADLRARLGMMVVKSTVRRVGGLKDKEIQARTQLRSKVWPEETMTGSAMRVLEMGQMNSGGGVGFLRWEGDRRRVNLHLCLLVPICERGWMD